MRPPGVGVGRPSSVTHARWWVGFIERPRHVGERAGRHVEMRAAREVRDDVVDDGAPADPCTGRAIGIERCRQEAFGSRVKEIAPAGRRVEDGTRKSAGFDEHTMLAFARALDGDARGSQPVSFQMREEDRRTAGHRPRPAMAQLAGAERR